MKKRTHVLFSIVLVMCMLIGKVSDVSASSGYVNVSAYGAVPNDGIDDSGAIQNAIAYAMQNNIQEVRFAAGQYDFKNNSYPSAASPGFGGNAYMVISGANSLYLVGATDANGNPTTKWVRDNPVGDGGSLRQLLYVEWSTDFNVKNVIVDNNPFYYSAGKVTAISGNNVTIEVLPGHPRREGMIGYITGSYNFSTKSNIKERIVWDGTDGVAMPVWHLKSGGNGMLMYTDHALLAQNINVGDGVFWFQGNWTDSCQMIMNYKVSGLNYENVKILNATGFALTADFCSNIMYSKVALGPDNTNRIAVAPRDGFKMSNASGTVLMDQVTVDGIGDDGQNCHGMWTSVYKKIDNNTIQCDSWPLNPGGHDAMTIGSQVKLLWFNTMEYYWTGTIQSYNYDSNNRVTIKFNEILPDVVGTLSTGGSREGATAIEPQCWYPTSYIVKNSTFRNAYRGLKISASNVVIDNCIFEYNRWAGIYMGAENDPWWIEGKHPSDVEVKNSTFRKNLEIGGIDIDFHGYVSYGKKPLGTNINVHNNTFYNEGTGIRIFDIKDSFFTSNTFTGCGTNISIDPTTTANISQITPPASDGWTASQGFSGVQGDYQWYYQQFNGTNYTNCTFDAPNNRWKGTAAYTLIGPGYMHPDAGYDAVRKWVAPMAGTISITGGIAKQVAQGDGVQAAIIKNGTVWLWSADITSTNEVNPTGVTSVTVAAGDAILFKLYMKDNSSYDATNWDPKITYK